MPVTSTIAATLAISAITLLALSTMLTRGADTGVSHSGSLFKTGNPGLGGSHAGTPIDTAS